MEKIRVRDVTAAIEEFAPLSLQEKWDNSGLCIGSPDARVTSVLLGLDCTPELVDEAVSLGADMIVADIFRAEEDSSGGPRRAGRDEGGFGRDCGLCRPHFR